MPEKDENNHSKVQAEDNSLAVGDVRVGGNAGNISISNVTNIYNTPEKDNALRSQEPVDGDSPYMGLRYFDTQDADLFYGRESLTRELLARVQKESFLAIVGASGSGKSSVARAGLIPAWKQENERSAIHVITPTAHPLESLAASLTRDSESVTATSTLMDDMSKDPRSLRLYVKKTLGETKLLLLVDQFEETFTLCKDGAERKAFIENLLSLADDASPRVVVTLRADFYHHCAEYEGLRNALKTHQEYIGAMTANELRQAITTPAEKNGWDFQPGLVDLILSDVGAEPGALPLLSHALLETWKRRQGRMLTLQGYHTAGGVKKAITQTAESVYDKLTPAEQVIARGIFLRLTELGEGVQDTRRRVKMEELVRTREQDQVTHVLKTLADARLVTTEENSAEVAHEALIREWGTLRKWLDEDREDLRLQRHLNESAQEWDSAGKDEMFLVHRGGRLDDLLRLKKNSLFVMTQMEQAYLNACVAVRNKEQSDREQRIRGILFISIAVALVFLFLGGIALVKSNEAVSQAAIAQANSTVAFAAKTEAEQQRNRAIALQLASLSQILGDNNGTALIQSGLLSIESIRINQDLAADQAIRKFISRTIPLTKSMYHGAQINYANFSKDDNFILSFSDDNTTRIWEIESEVEKMRFNQGSPVKNAVYTPDEKYIVTSGDDNIIRVWRVADGNEIKSFLIDEGVIVFFLTTDGKKVIAQNEDHTVILIDISSGAIEKVIENVTDNPIVKCEKKDYIAYSDDQSLTHILDINRKIEISVIRSNTITRFDKNCGLVATGGQDGRLQVWKTETNELLFEGYHDYWITSIAFDPNGKIVGTGGNDSTARIWEIERGIEISRMNLDAWITNIIISHDGKLIATSSSSGMVRLWESNSGKVLANIPHDNVVYNINFSTDDKLLLTVSENRIEVWNVETINLGYLNQKSRLTSFVIAPTGNHLASSGMDGAVYLWDLRTGSQELLIKYQNIANYVEFNHNGNYLISGSVDGSINVYDVDDRKAICDVNIESNLVGMGFVDDARSFIVVTQKGYIYIYNFLNCQVLEELSTNRNIYSILISPDKSLLVTSNTDNFIRVWNIENESEISEISEISINSTVSSMSFSPNNKLIAFGTEDNTIHVQDIFAGAELTSITHDGEVSAIAFNSKGDIIASASNFGDIKVWKTENGQIVTTLKHDGGITSILFEKDDRYIVSSSFDKTVRVWNLETFSEVSRITFSDYIEHLAIDPNDQFIISDDSFGGLNISLLGTDSLVEAACKRLSRNLTYDEWIYFLGSNMAYQPTCPVN